MAIRIPHAGLALTSAIVLSLSACGGGGGSPSAGGGGSGTAAPAGGSGSSNTGGSSNGNGNGTSNPESVTLSGVAATGAAFAQAAITVTDQTGATVCSTRTDDLGAYVCTLPAGTKAPLVIKAVRDDQAFYSTTASAEGGTVNVTPLTTIVVSQLSPDGNPASLAGAIQTQPAIVTASTIQTQVSELVAALKPLLDALGQGSVDLMGGAFVADGTGQDRVLDAISVSVLPTGGSANIEITVKTVPSGDGAAPTSIVFNTAAPTPTLPAIAATDLPATPTPAAVAALFQRMTACYALPVTQRVNTAANDTSNAVGDATNVSSPLCRTLFVGDDPATFYSNGANVGRDANNAGSFAGLFRAGATGLAYDRGNVEFVRTTGDFVLSYRQTDRNGNVDYDTIIARNVDGTLKLTGNNYAYRASVRPYSEDRELINSPAFDAFTTGYNVAIDNKTVNGTAIFDKVLVTPPFGAVRTFVPQPGLAYLAVTKDDNVTPTAGNVMRLAAGYKNASTPGNLSDKETNLYFVSPQYTEAQVSALQNQSVWKLEFVLAGHAAGEPGNAVQTYRTLSRAQTLGEVAQLKFAAMTPALKSEVISGTATTGSIMFGPTSSSEPNVVDFSAEGNLDGWSVPDGALAPTTFSVFGRAPNNGARFNDGINVTSSQRKAIIYCTVQSQGDPHCNSANGNQYAEGTIVNGFELWARNSRQVEVSKKLGVYKFQ